MGPSHEPFSHCTDSPPQTAQNVSESSADGVIRSDVPFLEVALAGLDRGTV
jgi:hypothetical protein